MKSRLLAGLLCVPLSIAAVSAAHAQDDAPPPVTGSLAITSDYTFRGLSQTNRKPALQGGLQYDHASGFYLGVWGSSISWLSDYEDVSSGVELDFYGGFKGSFAEDWSFDDSEKSDYIELNWNQPFADIWTLNAHVGKQTVDGFSDADYTDYKLGVTVSLPHGFSLSGAYVDTDAEKAIYTNAYGKFLGKQTGVLTLTKAF